MTPLLEVSTTIQRPVADVFAIIADPANDHHWSSAVIEAGITTAPPTGVGTTAHYVSRIFGRRMEYDWQITEFEPNRLLVATLIGGLLPTIAIQTVEPANGGTRYTVVYKTERRGIARVAWPFMAWVGARAWRQAQRTLKELMEANKL